MVCRSATARIFLAIIGFHVLQLAILEQDEDIPHMEVKNWALKFGVDLWEYGKMMTKMNELQRKYHDADMDVVRKDGLILIREMATEVKNMMDFKISAVKNNGFRRTGSIDSKG
ncbi:unnamed protein product [Acanthoscelides obtectus]|uniref:Uncharacterized protein n=1 Tax=Acanthoscelides obtectus TaxID=200917 RepID=A0A9P0NZE0_ACAOB|nr:unnamed protein product [Acanthoscelides obtectus]CAK1627989.1 hypothetical protein AOBTE_LOCUS4945 [Acanthoscelides obtectus]